MKNLVLFLDILFLLIVSLAVTSIGYYAYIETSAPRKELDFAMLKSGPFHVKDKCCFSLWFNANGKDVGSLIVLDGNSNIANFLGDRGNVWRKMKKTLSAGPHSLSIIGVRGKSYRGDIAIDDIDVVEGSCPKSTCSDQPCVEGFCIGVPGKISCVCNPGYTGKYCDTSINALQDQSLALTTTCQKNRCKNGFCIETPSNSTCVCNPGFTGDRCDSRKDSN
ncbi:uncharacterized protein TRIADDRAFT_60072 [Trichoplax adhaerens]|uniref:EGF-like domain-containing protein n=1 Tax=Trichoplax adhaerens TaxID=10228 RepID=B3S779_TRIAD|nr:predicted protein [Trichoplax adhaerens]EDV21525.1 predicted protein [Trichoplax adhaerens]|eukprot:XP_002116125.1 predicted protein [Trichoplax adhaerens]